MLKYKKSTTWVTLWCFLFSIIACTAAFTPTPAAAYDYPPQDQGHSGPAPPPSPGPGPGPSPDPDPDDDPAPDPEQCEISLTGMPARLGRGNFYNSHRDLSIASGSTRLQLDINRKYRSHNKSEGPFGYGWSFDLLNELVAISAKGEERLIIRNGNGVRLQVAKNPDGTFTFPTGRHESLVQNVDGSYDLAESATSCSSCGKTTRFDSSGRLLYKQDRNGNRLSYAYDPAGKISTITDPYGRQLSLSYGSNNKINQITDPSGRTFLYSYDARGNLTGYTDPLGNTTTYTYDDRHNLLSIVDPLGHTIQSMTYDSQDRLVSYTEGAETWTISHETSYADRKEVSDSSGNVWAYRFNAQGLISETLDPLHPGLYYNMDYTWDSNNNLISRIDRYSNRTDYTYDASGRKLTETDPNGNTTTYTYDPVTDQMATQTDPLGRVTRYVYDTSGNLIQRILDDGGPTQSSWSFAYDAQGNRTAQTDPNGNTTTYAYDAYGSLLQITDPLGATTRFTYDARGNPTSHTDPNGNTTTYTYDLMDRLLTVTDALGNTTSHTYDAAGNRTSITDPLGNTTTFAYDAYGHIIRQTDPNGDAISYAYDIKGRLTTITDPMGNATTLAYDAVGNRTSSTDPLGNTTTYAYISNNANYLLQSATDANGQTTQYAYDAGGRLQTITDASGGTTTYTYDAVGNMVSLTDANGNTTQFEYDQQQRLTRKVRPLLQEENFAYDAAGNLIQKIDANGQRVDYGYDGANRRTEARYYTDINAAAPSKTVAFTYDAAGNLTGYSDGATSASYTYDELNRRTGETVNYGGFSLTNTYGYNANGRLISFTGPNSINYQYAYDSGNRLTRVTIPDLGNIDISGYDWRQPTAITLPGGTSRQFGYNALLRPTAITVDDPGGTDLLNYAYSYDVVGNVATKNTEHGAYAYTYDTLYRLTQADNPTTVDEAFTYDPVGNRITDAGTSGNWSYNGNNELSGYDNVSFQYDSNGNAIERDAGGVITRFYYNLEDRLERVEDGAGTLIASYYYDPFGRRLWKEVGGTRTCFHYGNQGLIGEYDASGLEIRTYGWKPNSIWGTDPLFMQNGGTYYFYHNDHLGTPQMITSVSGAVVWSARYDSFGEASIDPASTEESNLRLAGQYYDQETGLHYNWHRYYDPKLGRYLSADPIGLKGGVNLYNYANSNPIVFSDPKGLYIYRGYCRYISGGEIIGVGVLRCKVWTACYNGGQREEGELVAIFGGLTGGLPASVTYFNIAQQGGSFSRDPTLDDLVGRASIYSVSSALVIGSSITYLFLGNTKGEYIADSYQAGIDASADAFVGYSYLESRENKCCFD